MLVLYKATLECLVVRVDGGRNAFNLKATIVGSIFRPGDDEGDGKPKDAPCSLRPIRTRGAGGLPRSKPVLSADRTDLVGNRVKPEAQIGHVSATYACSNLPICSDTNALAFACTFTEGAKKVLKVVNRDPRSGVFAFEDKFWLPLLATYIQLEI